QIFPLPLLYVGNHITGLASTKKLRFLLLSSPCDGACAPFVRVCDAARVSSSLPMFTVLRKFTILMTMVLEVYILRLETSDPTILQAALKHLDGLDSDVLFSRKRFPKRLVYSVMAIVLGAMVAACSDLAFDVQGYTFILLNDAFTAASNVYTKKNLGTEGLGKYGVLFYNALIIIVPTALASAFTGDLHKAVEFADWVKAPFVFSFLMSCFMGFVLMYSIVLCSYYNSALTTTIVGALKNVAVAYIGIFVGGDYLFSWLNFIGLSICMSGGLAYSFFTFSAKTPP
ncbi:unnamed protein product, partial [Tetraodon nigroviridis]